MARAVVVEPSPLLQTIRATADVVEIEGNGALCASVYLAPGGVAVARLARSIRGAPHEGEVLRWTMEHTTGAFGPGLFVLERATDGP